MKFSKKSWHYCIYITTYKSVPNNLCPYFWRLLFAIVMFPFNYLWNLPNKILEKFGIIDLTEEKPYFSARFVASTLVNLCLSILFVIIAMWWHLPQHGKQWHWIFQCGVFTFAVGLIVGFVIIIVKLVEKIGGRKKGPNIFLEFFKATYHKYCPTIEWEEALNKEK